MYTAVSSQCRIKWFLSSFNLFLNAVCRGGGGGIIASATTTPVCPTNFEHFLSSVRHQATTALLTLTATPDPFRAVLLPLTLPLPLPLLLLTLPLLPGTRAKIFSWTDSRSLSLPPPSFALNRHTPRNTTKRYNRDNIKNVKVTGRARRRYG